MGLLFTAEFFDIGLQSLARLGSNTVAYITEHATELKSPASF